MGVSREVIDTNFEDKILIGMIVSTPYLSAISPLYDSSYIDSDFGRVVASWCLDYYDQYKEAPGIHIEDLFDKKAENIDPDTGEMLKSFLNRISGEYSKAPFVNHKFLLDETKKEFNQKALLQIKQDLTSALDQKEDARVVFDYLKEAESTFVDINAPEFIDNMMTCTELLSSKIKQPKAIIWPWLRERSLNMIYAERGIGKSWLSMILGVAITRERYDELTIGDWCVKNPCGVLYVDGEMGNYDLQDRFRQIAEPLGKESRRYPLVTFSAPDYTEKNNESVNLNSGVWRDRFFKYFREHKAIRILVLDNLSSLCSGRDENDNQAATVLNEWFIKLRAIGVTVIIVHHAGKTPGQQRGASALEDPLNNSLFLSKPKNWEQGGGAHFRVTFTKARNDPGGEGYHPFEIRVVEHPDHHKWRQWIVQ